MNQKYEDQFNKIVDMYENAQFEDTLTACDELFNSLGIKLVAEEKETEKHLLAYHIKELQSYAYLSIGELEKGWDLWIYRSSARKLIPQMSKICTLPYWHGNKLGNKNLIIMAEEGLGDELFASSVFHLLKPYANKIYIQCDKRLRPLYERTYPEFTFFNRFKAEDDKKEFIEYGRTCSAYALMSDLPRYLDPLIERKEERYLKFDPEIPIYLRNPYAQFVHPEKPWYGVSYFTYNENQANLRNLPLNIWEKIRKQEGVFWNLQESLTTVKKKYLYEELCKLGMIGYDLFDDIDFLASNIGYLDKIISIANTVAHLSARLGKPTEVYIPKFTNCRWKLDLLPKKWHPTVTIKKMYE